MLQSFSRCLRVPQASSSKAVASRSLHGKGIARPSVHTGRQQLPRIPKQTISTTSHRNAQYVKFAGGGPEQKWKPRELILGAVVSGVGIYYLTQSVFPLCLKFCGMRRRLLICLECICSLERVPESGRWRFMDMNPKYETKVCASSLLLT